MLTDALPSSITKKPIPLFPWVVIASPSSKVRSCMRPASFFSSFGFTPWKRGTPPSVSTTSATDTAYSGFAIRTRPRAAAPHKSLRASPFAPEWSGLVAARVDAKGESWFTSWHALSDHRADEGAPGRDPRADRPLAARELIAEGGYVAAQIAAGRRPRRGRRRHRLPPFPLQVRSLRRGLPGGLAARGGRDGRRGPGVQRARPPSGSPPGSRSSPVAPWRGAAWPGPCSPSRSTRPSRPSDCISATATAT